MNSIARKLLGCRPCALAAVYVLAGVVWVPLGWAALDAALGVDTVSSTGVASGWVFVAGSGGLLYAAVAARQRRADDVRRELEASDQQLQVVSRVLRHNIRNDLNVVRGYTNLLASRTDDERELEYLATIRETTDDVVSISEKLRMLEEVKTGSTEGRVDLVGIVEGTVATVERDAEHVETRIDAPASAWIRADESCGYAVQEVLENAIAHNDEDTCRLQLDLERATAETRLVVQDNGPGIPDDELAVLQSAEETPLSHASSIGLWLVKWLCELQQGDVTFDANDDGTRVTLRFQSAPEPDGADATSAAASAGNVVDAVRNRHDEDDQRGVS
ncbi:hypothetical protein JCM17823_22680 [Halorubrum gandharaense]